MRAPFQFSQDGFTLIELLVVVVVAGVLLVMAGPSFLTMVQNNRIATQANDLLGSIGLARSEAVRRRASVTICASADQANCGGTDWSVGWIVFNDVNADGAVDGGDDLIRVHEALGGSPVFTGPTFVNYIASGLVNGAAVFNLHIPGCTGDQARVIAINGTGRAGVTRVACP